MPKLVVISIFAMGLASVSASYKAETLLMLAHAHVSVEKGDPYETEARQTSYQACDSGLALVTKKCWKVEVFATDTRELKSQDEQCSKPKLVKCVPKPSDENEPHG